MIPKVQKENEKQEKKSQKNLSNFSKNRIKYFIRNIITVKFINE